MAVHCLNQTGPSMNRLDSHDKTMLKWQFGAVVSDEITSFKSSLGLRHIHSAYCHSCGGGYNVSIISNLYIRT